jgi:hypothetical protein
VPGTSNRISSISSHLQIQDIEFAGYGMDAVIHCVKFVRLPYVEHWRIVEILQVLTSGLCCAIWIRFSCFFSACDIGHLAGDAFINEPLSCAC